MGHEVILMTRRTFGLSLCGVPLTLTLDAREAESVPWNQPAAAARVYLAGKAHWPMPRLDVATENEGDRGSPHHVE